MLIAQSCSNREPLCTYIPTELVCSRSRVSPVAGQTPKVACTGSYHVELSAGVPFSSNNNYAQLGRPSDHTEIVVEYIADQWPCRVQPGSEAPHPPEADATDTYSWRAEARWGRAGRRRAAGSSPSWATSAAAPRSPWRRPPRPDAVTAPGPLKRPGGTRSGHDVSRNGGRLVYVDKETWCIIQTREVDTRCAR